MRKLLLTLLIAGGTLASCTKEIIREVEKPEKPENQLNNGGLNNSGSSGSGSTSGSTSGSSVNNEPVKQAKIKTYYEAVQVQKQQTFYLNSATYLGLEKKTRITIPLSLPKNTVSFYYAISTASGKTPVKEVKLLTQVASALTGLVPLGSIISRIKVPEANTPGRVDVVLLSKDEQSNFINKDDYRYYPDGSRESLIKGTIEVSQIGNVKIEGFELSDFFYVGLRNPRTTTGVTVSFEAIAIVKKEKTVYE
ncbi:hypothetical protein [Capnocytophaga canis]|uniref:hypothetical protein n=1 Tax=Capnocytophaga canis TaxID=1848903 RepID=UPI0037D8AA00